MQVEPHLQPLSGEVLHYHSTVIEDDTRVNIRASGFWQCLHDKTFFDVQVLNCFAETNRSSALFVSTRVRSIDKRISEVEHGSFTPLIF